MDPHASPSRPTLNQLQHVANNYPTIDSHAHNLILSSHAKTIPFESITTEAQGRALRDTFKSLPYLRAAKQLRQLYECGEDADWEDILEQRVEWLRTDPQRLHQRCFEGIHAILVDDGLAEPDTVYPYDSHDEYLRAPSKRIVRIETVAERLMARIVLDADEVDLGKAKFLPDTWLEFTEGFEREVQEAVKDPEVAGFKSVICYRTGLDIEPDYEEAARAVGHPFERYVKNCIRKRNYRIERKALNDYIVLRTLEILSENLPHSDSLSKPLQFHTGFGDNDISLRESNPAYLQQVIEAYPSVPFVLLHSSYPYTREAGFLATVYRHVYLDMGKVFLMLSRQGQTTILRQALELVPGSKLLYSSDGRWFPESYWLASKQFREVWLELLTEYVEMNDITTFQAIAMTKDILFNNANTLYNLRYEAVFDDTLLPAPKQLTYNPKSGAPSPTPSPLTLPPAGSTRRPTTTGPLESRSGSPHIPHEPPSFPPPPKVPQIYDTQFFDKFMKDNSRIRFVYVQWLDYMATIRSCIVPITEFTRMIHEGDRICISQAETGVLVNDVSTPVVNFPGQIYIEPDLRSLRRTHNNDPFLSATVLSYWRSESGAPLPSCPRNNLVTLINSLQYNHSTTLLIGFEIEVTFLSRNITTTINTTELHHEPYIPLTQSHSWNTLNPTQRLQLPFLTAIVLGLDSMAIEFQQIQSESAPGQYKFILSSLPPLLAIDTLIQARETISQIAASHGQRATLYPSPFAGADPGTAAHAHISLLPSNRAMQFFVGGVLHHIQGICAFSLPEQASYTRDETMWVAWGTQNHKVPLRRISDEKWEVRCLDGTANMYFALGAVIAAGLLGLQSATEGEHYTQADLQVNPSMLDEAGRAQYGVLKEMPRSVADGLVALMADGALVEALGHEMVRDYVAVRESEQKKLDGMGEIERRVYLIERY